MPFRSIAAEPEELSALTKLFDEAWAELDQIGALDLGRDQAQRHCLSQIIIALWEKHETDLARQAVKRFLVAQDP